MIPFSVIFKRAGDESRFELISGKHFRFDTARFERCFRTPLPNRCVDLLRIASSAYAVDRLVRRRHHNDRCHWSRSIQIKIEVLEPAFWSTDDVREALSDVLDFLTDDTWDFSFIPGDKLSRREHQRPLFEINPESLFCLYSGGLDSAGGLINRVAGSPSRPIVPITVWHQPIQRKLVNRQYGTIRKRFASEFAPLVVKSALFWSEIKPHVREERSQRSRSFLFAAVGAIAAAQAKASEVEMLESGIGSINLPLMSGMFGSRATRSAHPEFLRRMSRLMTQIVDRPISYVLPFRNQTKGQMMTNASRFGLQDILPLTMSCVHYPLRIAGAKQCGVCPACIFRRQSLHVAGLTESERTYRYDLFQNVDAANSVPNSQLDYLKAFLNQIHLLAGVQLEHPLPLRISRHLFGTQILSSGESTKSVSTLLATYRDEWRDTVADAQGRGISWTKLLGHRASNTEGASHAVSREC